MLLPENQGHLVLKELELICRIHASEETLGLDAGIYRENMPHQEVYARLNRLRHLIKRIEFRHGNFGDIFRELSENFSTCAAAAVVLTYGMWRKSLYETLLSAYQRQDGKQYQEFIEYREFFDDVPETPERNQE